MLCNFFQPLLQRVIIAREIQSLIQVLKIRVRFFLFSFFHLFSTLFFCSLSLSFDASVRAKTPWAALTLQWRHLCLHQLLWHLCLVLSAGRKLPLFSALSPVVSYSVPGLFRAQWSHSRNRDGKKCLFTSTGVPWKCGITCWLLSVDPSSLDVTGIFLVLSSAKWLQQVEELRVSGTWREDLQGAEETLSRDLGVVAKTQCREWVPSSCEGRGVICQGRFSCCVDEADKSLHQECVCLTNRWLWAVCRQQVSFQGARAGITTGSTEQSCVTESANAEKSELLAHPVRLPWWKARWLWSSVWVLGFANPHFVKCYKW